MKRFWAALWLAAAMGIVAGQDDAKVEEWVKKLGDSEFAVREQAQAELAKIGAPALKALEKALQSPDPEVAQRARDTLEKIRRTQVVQSVLKAGIKVSLRLKEATLEEAARALGPMTACASSSPSRAAPAKGESNRSSSRSRRSSSTRSSSNSKIWICVK